MAWLRETVSRLGVAGLGAYGAVDAEQADGIVAKTARASSMRGNPITLDDDELHRILAAAT